MATKKAEEGVKKKGGKLKLIIILLVVLAILGGGGFAAWKFFLQPKLAGSVGNQTEAAPGEGEAQAEGGGEDGKKAEGGAQGEGGKQGGAQLVTLESFVVNLSDPMGRRYLKVTMDVEVANAGAANDLNANMPKIKDMLLMLFSSKAYADIASMEKKIELKAEIVDRLNLIVGKAKIKGVYFTEFVVQ